MYAIQSTSWFGARSVVACVALIGLMSAAVLVSAQDNCKIECYPNTKVINGKGGVGKGENCRWILRTDGKPARLCDHIKCKKVCPSSSQQDQQETAASSENLRIEQRVEGSDSPQTEPVGIMRHLHGNKIAKAVVPGVQSGRLTASTGSNQYTSAGRRMAPTLEPAHQYDENDTPPPISRFLDISPEE